MSLEETIEDCRYLEYLIQLYEERQRQVDLKLCFFLKEYVFEAVKTVR